MGLKQNWERFSGLNILGGKFKRATLFTKENYKFPNTTFYNDLYNIVFLHYNTSLLP